MDAPGTPATTLPGSEPGMKRWQDRRDDSSPDPSLLRDLAAIFELGVVEVDSSGRIVAPDATVEAWFPGQFPRGEDFQTRLAVATESLSEGESDLPDLLAPELFRSLLRGGVPRRALGGSCPGKIFNLITLPLEGDRSARVLVDFERENDLLRAYKSDLKHLASMREIIDLLYESMSVSEVIDLILVAVTASRGLGFNRAFFLEVRDGHLQGRRGIGPASVEEAREIWAQLDHKSPTLRQTLDLLSSSEGTPDPATQALVHRIDLSLLEGTGGQTDSQIVRACLEMRPTRLIREEASSRIDGQLFEILGSPALAVVPLNVQDRLEGVLLADNFITGQAVSEEHLKLLKTFSRYAALALERSSLLGELTENNQKLRQANRELQTHQRKLVQAEKLSALGKMAACVSHEIRNPLTAIGGLARSVHDDDCISEESREALQIIVSEVERLERFLRETLNFVKPSSGPFEPVDLCDVIRSVVHTFRESITGAGIDLVVDLPDRPLVSSLNADLLRGAVSNLIKNAREALCGRGTLGVHVEEAGGVVTIGVGDTGPGIPEGLHDLIFEPFFTNKDDGTGIGLAITQQNVRGLHGSISLSSDERYHTLFKIKIPL